MVLLEVVLLAGPAFAVGARAQQRSLALMVASGGTPAQSRRVVLAGAVVLGGTGAVVGVLLGLGLARLLQPVLQGFSQTWFGPFDVPWLHLLAVAAFGLLSAFLAAAVPAVLASRQDVVAVLAGRRGDAPASRRSPVLGAVLLAAGIGASAYGALQPSGGELAIAFGAIPAVLGMILLVPAVLSLVARGAGRLPLTLRYAVRDAHRHRTRTVPAVAAVAATVAGVVALGIGLSSDQREAEETYVSSVADGVGVVRAYEQPARWDALRGAVEREAPGVQVVVQQGLTDSDGGYTSVQRPEGAGFISAGSALGSMVLVSDGPLPPGLVGLSDADARRAEQALGDGRSVVFTGPGVRVDDGEATVVRSTFDEQTGQDQTLARVTLPATYLPLSDPYDGPSAILTPAAAAELGQEPSVVSLLVTGGLDGDQEDTVQEALKGVDPSASIYVERGFQPESDALIAQLVLLGLGGVLMLGGTLTATFLALSDARPDLATLAAVGASPRTRRGVAAAYALVVGGIGSVLGALVGSIPGVAVTWPLTSSPGFGGGGPTGPFLDVPWLMLLALVVALPVLTALVVGASARSRLPLVSRLD
nr:FtsX-like permease family protein [Nocardioides flavescens]